MIKYHKYLQQLLWLFAWSCHQSWLELSESTSAKTVNMRQKKGEKKKTEHQHENKH